MSKLSPGDRRWLDAAVRLARIRLGTTGLFPATAALIVDASGLLLAGRGITGPMGRPSAVVAALADARGRTEGATAYLTIEPDDTAGPYESEAERLAGSGIARAIVGALNPDKDREGRGLHALRERGVEVIAADHEPSRRLVEGYAARIRRRRPFVTAILAVSLDGMVAGRDGTPVELSLDARRWIDVQRLRNDALLTTAQMERNGLQQFGKDDAPAVSPIVVVVSGAEGSFPAHGGEHFLFVEGAEQAVDNGDGTAATLRVPSRDGRLDLRAMLTALADRGINALQVEAGARLTENLVSAELVDRFHLLEAMLEIGRGGVPATPLGTLDARLRAAGFEQSDELLVGANRLRTFERAI